MAKWYWRAIMIFALLHAARGVNGMELGEQKCLVQLASLTIGDQERAPAGAESAESAQALAMRGRVSRSSVKRIMERACNDHESDLDDESLFPPVDRSTTLCHWPEIDIISPLAAARRKRIARWFHEARCMRLMQQLEEAQQNLEIALWQIDRWYMDEQRKINLKPGNRDSAQQLLLKERDKQRRAASGIVEYWTKELEKVPHNILTPAQTPAFDPNQYWEEADFVDDQAMREVSAASSMVAVDDDDDDDDELVMVLDEGPAREGDIEGEIPEADSQSEVLLGESGDWGAEPWLQALEEQDRGHVKAVLLLCENMTQPAQAKQVSLRVRREVRSRAIESIYALVCSDKFQILMSSFSAAGFCQHSFAEDQERILWRMSVHFRRLLDELSTNPFFRIATCEKCVRLVAS